MCESHFILTQWGKEIKGRKSTRKNAGMLIPGTDPPGLVRAFAPPPGAFQFPQCDILLRPRPGIIYNLHDCPHRAAQGGTRGMSDIEKKLEAFLNEFEREGYETGAGLKEDADFTSIYERHSGLFTPETAAAAREDVPAANGRDTLAAFITVNIIDNALKEPMDELLTSELKTLITVQGKEVPFRQAQVLISNEPDPAARREIDTLRRAAQRGLNPMYADLQRRSHLMAMDMGYSDYVNFFQELENLDLTELRTHTRKLLKETEAVYLKLLDSYRTELLPGVAAADLEQCDMAFMRRASHFDSLFPADAMVSATWKTLGAMGVDAEHNPNITLDIEHRDNKSPRAFCSPVKVPDEVYLVIMPHGGADDYNSFMHELGHTLHFAYADPALPVAHRFLGDNSVTEAHAMTMEYLSYCGPWLAWALGKSDTAAYLKFMDFFELYMLRRYSAKLHYEMDLHGGEFSLGECANIYADTLTRATHVQYDADDYLRDVDPHFYCARYLRAWMLRRQIIVALEQKFGEKWFAGPDAGRMLRGLWALGQKEDAEAVSARVGFHTLDMDAIIAHYTDTYA